MDIHKGNNLRAGRWSESLVRYSITKCVLRRRRILDNEQRFLILINSLKFLRDHDRIRVLAFCVMPDHLHLLLFILADNTLTEVMRSFSRATSRQLNVAIGSSGPYWQEGFHDHRCRNEEDIHDLLSYIEQNPVRAGFVKSAHDWKFSSAAPAMLQHLDRDWYASVR
jgi:REP element-mobilizing transposase RayT